MTVFWLDDRDGRYADVLREHAGVFDGIWGDIAPVEFACAAWRLATPPVSDPGFIRRHRRVLSVRCERNTYDGSVNGRVEIAAPPPAELSRSKTWWRDQGWQGWPEIFGQFVTPSQADLAKVPYVRPVLLVDVPVPLDDLPPTPEAPGDDLPETAHRALLVLVRELDSLVAPLISQLG
jgi:hypothetical protein